MPGPVTSLRTVIAPAQRRVVVVCSRVVVPDLTTMWCTMSPSSTSKNVSVPPGDENAPVCALSLSDHVTARVPLPVLRRRMACWLVTGSVQSEAIESGSAARAAGSP